MDAGRSLGKAGLGVTLGAVTFGEFCRARLPLAAPMEAEQGIEAWPCPGLPRGNWDFPALAGPGELETDDF